MYRNNMKIELMKLLTLAVFLSGCTVNVVDKRLPPEEVHGAFKEVKDAIAVRDSAMAMLASEIKKLQEFHKKDLKK